MVKVGGLHDESGVKAGATEKIRAPEDAKTEPLVSAGAPSHPLIKYHLCLQLERLYTVDVHSAPYPFTPPPPPRVGVSPGSVVEWHDPGKMRVPIPKGRGRPGSHLGRRSTT